MSGREGKGYTGCVGAFWDGVVVKVAGIYVLLSEQRG